MRNSKFMKKAVALVNGRVLLEASGGITAATLRAVAETGVDIIQFDDDFRYGFLGDSPACLCDRHIAEICRLTGDKITREEIRGHI